MTDDQEHCSSTRTSWRLLSLPRSSKRKMFELRKSVPKPPRRSHSELNFTDSGHNILSRIRRFFRKSRCFRTEREAPVPIENSEEPPHNIRIITMCDDESDREEHLPDIFHRGLVEDPRLNCRADDAGNDLEISRASQQLAVEERPNNIYVNMTSVRERVADSERKALVNCCWYWGPLSRCAAQRQLTGHPNGTFLVRDSQTDQSLFTLSFRSAGCTLHCRIEYRSGYWIIENSRHNTLASLIEDTMQKSAADVFCFVRTHTPLQPEIPVRLTTPLSRFKSSSLQHLCRVIIRNSLSSDLAQTAELPLPPFIISYLNENFYENI